MINKYELKITEGGGTTMVQEFGIAMHMTDTNTEEDSLTEAVTKYAERATQAEANMAEMKATFEERSAMLSMTSPQPQPYAPPSQQYQIPPPPMQTAYFTPQHPTFIPPTATIHVPSPQQPPLYQQQYLAGKKRCKGQGPRSQGGGANHNWQGGQPFNANQQSYGGGGRGGGTIENPNF